MIFANLPPTLSLVVLSDFILYLSSTPTARAPTA